MLKNCGAGARQPGNEMGGGSHRRSGSSLRGGGGGGRWRSVDGGGGHWSKAFREVWGKRERWPKSKRGGARVKLTEGR
jgi:hypothetical protein